MFIKLLVTVFSLALCQAAEFSFQNNDENEIWVGILPGNEDSELLCNGGFKLGPGEIKSLHANDLWVGSFWARTHCNSTTNRCLTGDCGGRLECLGKGPTTPAVTAEIALLPSLSFYDISLAKGFNIDISITPITENGKLSTNCEVTKCGGSINEDCPSELALETEDGLIGCKDACDVFHEDRYCCRGDYADCDSTQWPVDYFKFFKNYCPNSYVSPYDTDVHSCNDVSNAFLITFG